MRQRSQATGFLVSVALHALALAAALLAGALPSGGCRTRRQELQIPIGFLVESAEDPGTEPETAPPEPEPPKPAPDETPAPPKPEPKKPDPPKKEPEKPKKHEVKVNKDKVVRRTPPPTTRPPKPAKPPGKPLSAKDIAEMMRDKDKKGVPGGSPHGSPTATPNADGLLLARMQTTLYGAWCQPVRDERGRRPAVVRLTMRPDGSFEATLAESSGSASMDRSALDAARGVRRFAFLTPDFVRRNPQVEIEFTIEDR